MKKLLLIGTAAALVFASCAKKGSDGDIPTIPTYTVAFELNGGSGVEPITVDSGATVQPPAEPTRVKSCFLGWYSDSSCTDTFDFATPITANITVYAKWSKRHTITLVLNGGVGDTVCYVCNNHDFPELSKPTKSGYSFVNWCIDSVFSAPWQPHIRATKDTIVYAQWIDGIKIERSLDGGMQVKQPDGSWVYVPGPMYWIAYADEPGLYTNQTTGDDHSHGRYNTGGEANDVCRSKGDGWYLPASGEYFTPDSSGNYWTSTRSHLENMAYYIEIERSDYGQVWQPRQGLRTLQMRVRCVWRPSYPYYN